MDELLLLTDDFGPSAEQELVAAVVQLGHYPKEYNKPKTELHKKEQLLAHQIRKARFANRFQPEQLSKLDEIFRNVVHPDDRARSTELLEEAHAPPARQTKKCRTLNAMPTVE